MSIGRRSRREHDHSQTITAFDQESRMFKHERAGEWMLDMLHARSQALHLVLGPKTAKVRASSEEFGCECGCFRIVARTGGIDAER